MKAIYPGTFDPVTNGHLDIIHRAANIFSKLVIAVAENESKKPLLTLEQRVSLLEESLRGTEGVEVRTFGTLLVHFARENGARIIIRGLRAVSDFEFEFQMALMNKKMASSIETFFMMPDERYTYLSSREIKEIAFLGGDVSPFVPPAVKTVLSNAFRGGA
jgi:pantetheine-phosphate adenylyltransferase